MTTMIDRRIQKHCGPHAFENRKPSILCVDDDPDIQTTIELRMREYNVEIERAFYGMQGIVEAIKTRPDLILMDLAMPNGDGQYLLDSIKRNAATADIPVIILTGMRDPMLKQQLLNAGADVFLQKPAHFDELLHHISRFIDIRQQDDDEELR